MEESAGRAARHRRADPAAHPGARRARPVLRERVHRDPRPVAAAAVAASAAAARGGVAGAAARGARTPGTACRRGQRAARRWRAPCWRICRRTIRASRAMRGRRRGCWPSAPASRPRASAAPGRSGTRCAPSACRPRRWSRRCSICCRAPGWGGCSTSAPAPGGCSNCWRRASRPGWAWMPAGRCWRWRGRGWRGPGFAHCAVRLADMYRLPLPDVRVRRRGAADGAAPCRDAGGGAGGGGAGAAAGRAAGGDRPRAARQRRLPATAGASLARLFRCRDAAAAARGRAGAGRTGVRCVGRWRCASGGRPCASPPRRRWKPALPR